MWGHQGLKEDKVGTNYAKTLISTIVELIDSYRVKNQKSLMNTLDQTGHLYTCDISRPRIEEIYTNLGEKVDIDNLKPNKSAIHHKSTLPPLTSRKSQGTPGFQQILTYGKESGLHPPSARVRTGSEHSSNLGPSSKYPQYLDLVEEQMPGYSSPSFAPSLEKRLQLNKAPVRSYQELHYNKIPQEEKRAESVPDSRSQPFINRVELCYRRTFLASEWQVYKDKTKDAGRAKSTKSKDSKPQKDDRTRSTRTVRRERDADKEKSGKPVVAPASLQRRTSQSEVAADKIRKSIIDQRKVYDQKSVKTQEAALIEPVLKNSLIATDSAVRELEYLSYGASLVLLETFKSSLNQSMTNFEVTNFGYEFYPMAEFYEAFFGDSDEASKIFIEHLFYVIFGKFYSSCKHDLLDFSGKNIMELVVLIMNRSKDNPFLHKLKWVINPLLIAYNYFIDELFYECYQLFSTKETSLYMQDRPVYIKMGTHRLLLLEFFFGTVQVSHGTRKNITQAMNPRMIDIVLTWVREKIDNSIIMPQLIDAVERALDSKLEELLIDI